MPTEERITRRFGAARSDATLVVLEGFHAVKHALRFGADIDVIMTDDRSAVLRLAERLAPDVGSAIESRATTVSTQVFDRLSPTPPATRVVAIARRVPSDAGTILDLTDPAPVVVLDRPSRLGNLGASIRVTAAAGGSGLVSLGRHDPWHPESVRGAAGLQFAIPIGRAGTLPDTERPIVAVDPDGVSFTEVALPPRPVLVFGSERDGIEDTILSRASYRVSIPMRASVSSLNLATSVAVVLYAWFPASERVARSINDR